MSSFLFSLLDQAYPWYNKVMRLDKLLGQSRLWFPQSGQEAHS